MFDAVRNHVFFQHAIYGRCIKRWISCISHRFVMNALCLDVRFLADCKKGGDFIFSDKQENPKKKNASHRHPLSIKRQNKQTNCMVNSVPWTIKYFRYIFIYWTLDTTINAFDEFYVSKALHHYECIPWITSCILFSCINSSLYMAGNT